MESIITRQKDVLNGNVAFLLGVDKLGQQIWLEVLNGIEIKCEAISLTEINLNKLLDKKVYEAEHEIYLNWLFNQYIMITKYLKRHPEERDYKLSANYKNMITGIIDILKPTL
jgi:hypothetical protein